MIARCRTRSRYVKIVACLAVALLLCGCIPIGARVSNMYAQAPAAQPAR